MELILFSIRSVSSDRELIFSSRQGDYFRVELKGAAISASKRVWAPTTEGIGLNTFFQELASFKTPWQDARGWGSLEEDFEISVTCTTLGQVVFLVKLSGLSGETEDWGAQTGLETELGQLEKIARNSNEFFRAVDADVNEE